ncbi:T6SS phospholipase effector Tle1-like catalytic domain-containing protein [Sphaerotilus mobilis]|uniref:Uncharacterized protein (DUF2235 family) n=1 Tax=Sphaerotilus mobilis TaxID=47994 RepID=A0A4V2EX05_9BURK|nr:DUF2235 domain-containing protein [Sphaerotilus mobilis]RZS57810.1 uncharacterized protein (DUF2235 family) [Sphaerotilus mobilis]
MALDTAPDDNRSPAPRNLIICFDGTNNKFGSENTNVVRLVQSLERDPRRQLVYYDPGVGTLPEPGLFTGIGKKISEIAGLAFGVGLNGKITGGYRYLMEHWRPGDHIYIFGFSRGAYTARALAALLHLFGLLPAGSENLLPYLMRKFMSSSREYKAAGTQGAVKPGVEPSGPYRDFCAAWRDAFARDVPGQSERRLPVHFIGVWDTVKSVGWFWEPLSLPFTAFNPGVAIVRHAIALDERRAFFRQNRFSAGPAEFGQDLVERWFPGVHADVGGGYPPEQGSLWRVAFCWMVANAHLHGLAFDVARLERVIRVGLTPEVGAEAPGSVEAVLADAAAMQSWVEPAHVSLTKVWWPAEVFPKLVSERVQVGSAWVWKNRLRLNLGAYRTLSKNSMLDDSVVQRILALPGYRPRHARLATFPETGQSSEARSLLG